MEVSKLIYSSYPLLGKRKPNDSVSTHLKSAVSSIHPKAPKAEIIHGMLLVCGSPPRLKWLSKICLIEMRHEQKAYKPMSYKREEKN